MHPQTPCCHQQDCPARGQVGQGNMRVHSRAEQRSQCPTCGQRVAATKGTPCDRLRTAADVVTVVLTLLAMAVRSRRAWRRWVWIAYRRRVADPRRPALPAGPAAHGPARPGGPAARPGRCAVGGAGGPPGVDGDGDGRAVAALAGGRQQPPPRSGLEHHAGAGGPVLGRSLALLVGVDGRASSVTACRHVCRDPVRTGHRGRPRWVLEAGLRLGPVVTRSVKRRVARVEHRVGRGTAAAIAGVVAATHRGSGMHTSSIERLNATFRASLAPGSAGGGPSPTPRRP